MDRITLIERYIEAYNTFDVEGMVAVLDSNVYFQNIVEGEVNLSLLGKTAFKEQAIHAANAFESRKQTILDTKEGDEGTIEIRIAYTGKVAMDMPNGLQAGQEITMEGRSVFGFSEDKIVLIKDIS